MKLINPILLTLNNTLHIKADNLEPVEVDSSCVDELEEIIIKKWSSDRITSLTFDNYLKEGINILELSDMIQIVRDVNCPLGSPKAFLLHEKEDKCDGKCVPNECLCEWEDMTKEQVKAEALPSITEKYGKSFEKSYTIEEIEKAINGVKLVPHYDEILKIIKKQILNNLKKLTNTY